MSWHDAIVLAARSVVRRIGRAALTVVAVTLAAALLVALLTIAGTARNRVLDQLAKGGPLAGIRVAAAEPDPGSLDSDNARPGPARDLDDAALNRIRALPDVTNVIPIVTSRVIVLAEEPTPPIPEGAPSTTSTARAATSAGGEQRERADPFAETMVGVDLARATQLPITLVAGRLPLPDSTTEVAVTEGYLKRFGVEPEQAARVVGSEVQIGSPRLVAQEGERRARGRWSRSTVVGVVAQEAGSGQLLAPLRQSRTAREWTLAGGEIGQFELPTSPYGGLFVVADGIDKVSPVRAAITEIGYATTAPENLLASVTRYLRVVEIVLSGIGTIALVIAALGIANGLLAAVRERRREIGVMKAIGARDRDVRRVFLVEAGVLGFIGGLLGTFTGYLIARAVGAVVNDYLAAQGLVGVEPSLPLTVLVGGVVGSTLVALAAGTLPAVRAARLPAREAVGG